MSGMMGRDADALDRTEERDVPRCWETESVTWFSTPAICSCRDLGNTTWLRSKDCIASSQARLEVRKIIAGVRFFWRRVATRSTGWIDGGMQFHSL